MFDKYVFLENSCRNYARDGRTAGFKLQTLITYYRGIPLSMVYDLEVSVDGLPVPRELLSVSTDGKTWFTLAEAETVASEKWEYGDPLTIRAAVPGGLRRGEHDVRLALKVFPAYYPMPAGGERTRRVIIS